MTAVTEHPPATRGQLRDLAIAFAEAGVTDRAEKLARACTFAGRPITSSNELTRIEAARLLADVEAGRLPAPAPDAPPPARKATRRAPATGRLRTGHTPGQVAAEEQLAATLDAANDQPVAIMRNGQPNPTGPGAYCAPNRCYCHGCPGWEEQNAAAQRAYEREVSKALRELAERNQRRAGYRR